MIDFNNKTDLNNDFFNFNIFLLNARSIVNYDRFNNLKTMLSNTNIEFHLIVICETWIKDYMKSIYNLPGYNSIFSCRESRLGGGLVVFIKENIKFDLIEVKNTEVFSIDLELLINNEKILVTALYRPPDTNINDFLMDLNDHLFTLNSKNCNSILLGDINIDISEGNSSINTFKYKNILDLNGFHLCNHFVTRESSKTVLDHIISNFSSKYEFNISTIFNTTSDHNILISTINLPKFNKSIQTIIKKFTDYDQICVDLEKALIENKPDSDDPNILLEFLTNQIKILLDKHTTEKVIKIKEKEICPWFNVTLKKLINSKCNLRKKFKKRPFDIDLLEKLQCLTKNIFKLKRKLHNEYYLNMFNDECTPKQKWKNINLVLGNAPPNSSIKNIINENNVELNDSKDIANEFNKFFVDIGHKLEASFPSANNNFNKFGTCSSSDTSIFLLPATYTEIKRLIDNLDIHKSVGSDNISNFTIKKLQLIIIPSLCEIFNLCLKKGVYPDILKISKVTPVFKSGKKSFCNNFRPIAVLPGINKLFEKLLEVRLRTFLNKQNYFYKNQYGFRVNSDTKSATSDLINNILLNIDKKCIVTGLFLDLTKAFDTVNREILVEKLKLAGIRGRFLDLFKNYLTNRQQYVIINNQFSQTLPINIGVPQGSVLGPLFFIIYINDFGKLNLKGNLRLYADDSALFYTNKKVEDNINLIKDDLELISDYLNINKLTLSIGKSNFINFCSTHKHFDSPSEIKFGNSFIKKIDKVKYLGLIIDQNLTWTDHIRFISSKVSAVIGIITKLRHSLPRHILLNIYHSFINCHFQYLILIWGASYRTHLHKLQTLQNSVLKYIYFKDRLHNTVDLFENVAISILPIYSTYLFQLFTFIFCVLKNLIYNNFNFDILENTHSTRSGNNNLVIPIIRTNYGKFSISYSGPNLYNRIPNCIKGNSKLHGFQKDLKTYLLSNDELKKSLS